MTVSEGPQFIVDPEASLRAELIGAITAAQADIASAIAELARSGADSSALAAQTQTLQQLQRTVGNANLGGLLALRGEVAATATNASNLAHQAASTAANSSAAHGHMTPAERARANIEALHRDLFEKRVLDPYLQFNSPEEEEAYRKRERERKDEIDRAMALGTPEGDRLAAQLFKDQLTDAKAHGAGRSPDFDRLITTAEETLEATALSEKHDSKRADTQPAVSKDVAGIAAALRAAGLSNISSSNEQDGHGLSFDKLAAATRSSERLC